MAAQDFFKARREQSDIKSLIVKDYFPVWAKIILKSVQKSGGNKIAYIDLFSGPGKYDDGSESTPLLILKTAVSDQNLQNALVTIFNDKNRKYCESLKTNISVIPGIEKLRFTPKISNFDIGEDTGQVIESMNLVPTFLFIDPWGYKGITKKLIGAVLKSWGSECFFFFNYDRLNRDMTNVKVEEHINAIFGEVRANSLRALLPGKSPGEREAIILSELLAALKEVGGEFAHPIRFPNPKAKRTSHYLVFITKHPLGYGIMKDITAKYCRASSQGIPSFEFKPERIGDQEELDFHDKYSLEQLKNLLLNDFAGQRIRMIDIYNHHRKGYLKRNYKAALIELEIEDKISAEPPLKKRPIRKGKPTFRDTVMVTFSLKKD